ncbi:MAG: hypothetical protein Q9162_004666 [Coniocarpon cinnabarinum]
MDSGHGPSYYSSYTDFLSTFRKLSPKFNAVHEFLTQLHLFTTPGHSPPEGAYVIYESQEPRSLEVEQHKQPERLRSALENQALSPCLHLVVLHYSDHGLFHKCWIEELGHYFDLDPIYLFNHLLLCSDGSKFLPLHEIDAFQDLLSRRRSLELGCAPWVHASISLRRGKNDAHDTVIMLLHTTELNGCVKKGVVDLETPTLSSNPDLVHELSNIECFVVAYLREMRNHHQRQGELSLETILLPLGTKLAQYFMSTLAEYRWRHRKQFQDLDDVHEIRNLEKFAASDSFATYRYHYDLNLERLKWTIDSLENPGSTWRSAFLQLHSKEGWTTMLNDFHHILANGERDRQELQAYVAHCLQHFKLVNAVNARHQSTLNRGLSILAFIYIPLSFVTSFFGMNVSKWIGSDGAHLPLWIPVASGLSLLGATIFILFFILISGWMFYWCRRHLGWFPGRLYIIARFAKYRPDYAFWITIFMFTHHHFITFDLCRRLGIDDVIWGRAVWVRPNTFPINYRVRSDFWRRQWWLVARYLEDPDWSKKPLLTRWWRSKSRRQEDSETAENGMDWSGTQAHAIEASMKQHRREWKTLPAHNRRPHFPDKLSQLPGSATILATQYEFARFLDWGGISTIVPKPHAVGSFRATLFIPANELYGLSHNQVIGSVKGDGQERGKSIGLCVNFHVVGIFITFTELTRMSARSLVEIHWTRRSFLHLFHDPHPSSNPSLPLRPPFCSMLMSQEADEPICDEQPVAPPPGLSRKFRKKKAASQTVQSIFAPLSRRSQKKTRATTFRGSMVDDFNIVADDYLPHIQDNYPADASGSDFEDPEPPAPMQEPRDDPYLHETDVKTPTIPNSSAPL